MQVHVKLFLDLRQHQDSRIELKEGADAEDLIRCLSIPIEEVGVLSINNRSATIDNKLKDGDVITIVPPIGGG